MNLKAAKEDLKQYVMEGKDIAKFQAKSFAIALSMLMAFYLGSVFIQPGLFTYLLCVPPSFVIALTALARVNDIGVEKTSKRWQLRRIGLVLTGAAAVMLLASYWTPNSLLIPWRAVVMVYGVAFTWLTTPEMPPWEDYMTGKYRDKDYRILKNFLGSRRVNPSAAVNSVPIVEITPAPPPGEDPPGPNETDTHGMRRGDGEGP